MTLDADFHQLLAATGESLPSVVRVRIQGLSHESLAELLKRELPVREAVWLSGVAISISKWGVRIRKLPLPTLASR